MDLQFFAPTNIGISESSSASVKPVFSVYPNPVSDVAQITVKISSSANVSLEIYSMLGKCVKAFKSGVYPEGQHAFLWYPSDSDLKSGTYFARLTVGKFVQVQKNHCKIKKS